MTNDDLGAKPATRWSGPSTTIAERVSTRGDANAVAPFVGAGGLLPAFPFLS